MALHNILLCRINRKRECWKTVGSKVYIENLNCREWQGNAHERRSDHQAKFTDIGGKEVGQIFFDVVIDSPTLFHSRHNRCKVVVSQHHGRSLL